MRQDNYEYLLDQLKYTGFKDSAHQDLKSNMENGNSDFSLEYQNKFGQDEAKAVLQFHKSTKEDMYFFNSYVLEVTKGNTAEAIQQKFYISNKEDNITLKEGFNLLQGRAVYKELTPKEGPKYSAWVQLDFKQTDSNGNYERKTFHQNYGYDLAATLSKHPILELNDDKTKKMLMESLERGNRQSVTYMVGDEERKMFIEAVPQFKSINIYDMNLHRLKPDQLAVEPSQAIANKEGQKQDKQQKASNEGESGNKTKSKNHSKRAGIS